MVQIADLVPHPKNPNSHPPEQVERLAQIIEFQGWRYPIKVSNRSGYITSGHGRLEAALLRGWNEVPVSRQDYDSEEQEIADLVADNAIAEWSALDFKSINEMVPDLGPDFDLDLLGIKDFALDVSDKQESDPDAVPANVASRCQRGDRWLLGDHVLVCGDSSDASAIQDLMRGERAELVFTDPPYNWAGDIAASSIRKSYKRLAVSEWDKDFKFSSVEPSIESAIADDCSVYVCTSHHLIGEIIEWMKRVFDFEGLLVWSKPNPMPSMHKRHWTWQTEFICYATKGKHVFNFPVAGHAASVWEFAKTKSNDLHPTMKPVELCMHAITHSSDRGQRVLDLFGGSGSTLIACQQSERKCFTMEIDPKYCDVILTRWEQYTGRTAELEAPVQVE